MELELKKECLEACDLCGNLTLAQEESTDTIVPDYCPDIARIISTNGTVFIHSRGVRDGKGEVSGSIQVSVLYTPEGNSGVRLLEFAMPFTVESEANSLPNCLYLSADSRIELLESRMLNPRKIFTRCKLITQLTGYQKGQLCFTSNVSAEESKRLEKNTMTQHAVLLRQISEKDFTFRETIDLSPGRAGAAELLTSRISHVVTETKLIGQKLILKGLFHVQMLYRSTEGEFSSTTSELPFSQIMEMEDVDEGATVLVQIDLTGRDLQISGADSEGRDIDMTLYFHVCALVRESMDITLLSDLYSTAYETSYETAPLSICGYYAVLNRKQAVREVLEIGVIASALLSVQTDCGPVTVSRDGKAATLCSSVQIRALYLDEGGSCLTAERTLEVRCQLEIPENCTVSASADTPEEIQSSIGERGIEVRFTVDFCAEVCEQVRKIAITKAELNEEAPKDFSHTPSLVLRYFGKQESVWDMAKRYNTTISDILSANQVESAQELPCERLLLIPRKRA